MSAASVTPRQVAIANIKTLLSTFFTDQQLSVSLDRMAANIYAGKSLDDTFDALIPLDVLPPSHLAKWTKMESGLQNDLGANSSVPRTKARTVFLRSFSPFYNEASTKVLTMKRSGKSKAESLTQVDVLLNKHLTRANVARALNEYKSSLTSEEWRSVRTHGAELLLWSKYGL